MIARPRRTVAVGVLVAASTAGAREPDLETADRALSYAAPEASAILILDVSRFREEPGRTELLLAAWGRPSSSSALEKLGISVEQISRLALTFRLEAALADDPDAGATTVCAEGSFDEESIEEQLAAEATRESFAGLEGWRVGPDRGLLVLDDLLVHADPETLRRGIAAPSEARATLLSLLRLIEDASALAFAATRVEPVGIETVRLSLTFRGERAMVRSVIHCADEEIAQGHRRALEAALESFDRASQYCGLGAGLSPRPPDSPARRRPPAGESRNARPFASIEAPGDVRRVLDTLRPGLKPTRVPWPLAGVTGCPARAG